MKAPDPCAMPTAAPYWIDFADGSVPFWQLFARPGIIGAGSSQTVLPQLRAAGASTVYFDLYMRYRVGNLTEPLDTETVVAKSNELFDLAVMRTGCPTPRIAENELFSANAPAPWTGAAAQYRENVLTMVKTLAARGAQTYLLVSKPPARDDVAAAWWRELSRYSYLVPEVYLNARQTYSMGPIAGSRRLRVAMRRELGQFMALGIAPERLGMMLGFQVAPGTGGREGLEPETAWFRHVKWQALAAKQVASEIPIESIWSWGWGTWNEVGDDPDKQTAACVYLWTRNSALCDALAVAGAKFNSSLSEAQLVIPAGARCLVGSKRMKNTQVAALRRLTGDEDAAASALYVRLIEKSELKKEISSKRVAMAERVIVARRFRGSRAAYRRALSARRVSPEMAREIVADELRRRILKATLPVGKVSEKAISDYYHERRKERVRLVAAGRPADWLGGRRHGYALASIAPVPVFRLRTGSEQTVRTALGDLRVTALGTATTLGKLPRTAARRAIRSVLIDSARDDAYARWTVVRQVDGLGRTRCVKDRMPLPSPPELAEAVPFFSLRGL